MTAEDGLRIASYSIRVLLLLTQLSPLANSGWACSLFTGPLTLDNESTFVIYLRIRNLWAHRDGCSMFTSVPLGYIHIYSKSVWTKNKILLTAITLGKRNSKEGEGRLFIIFPYFSE